MSMHRRVYGPYRLQHPMVRKGWRQWADDGFPELTPDNRDKYKFTSRGQDTFVQLTWDEAYDYMTRGMVAIATAYSGEAGAKRLEAEGYQPEMIEAMKGAGTRTFKLRGGMGLLGVIGKSSKSSKLIVRFALGERQMSSSSSSRMTGFSGSGGAIL